MAEHVSFPLSIPYRSRGAHLRISLQDRSSLLNEEKKCQFSTVFRWRCICGKGGTQEHRQCSPRIQGLAFTQMPKLNPDPRDESARRPLKKDRGLETPV